MANTPCIVHLIVGLNQGGAEQSLKRLVTRSNDHHIVICVGPSTPISEAIRAAGVDMHHCQAWNLVRLYRLIKSAAPDVVQGWMYYGNFLTSLLTFVHRLGKSMGNATTQKWRAAWNIRSAYQPSAMPWRFRITSSPRLKRDLVIFNSAAGKSSFGSLNVPSCVIDNGVDTALYKPDPAARLSIRQALGIEASQRLIGLVSRYHADKGLFEFLTLQQTLGNTENQLVLVGRGMNRDNQALQQDAQRAGVDLHDVLCLGERSDLH